MYLVNRLDFWTHAHEFGSIARKHKLRNEKSKNRKTVPKALPFILFRFVELSKFAYRLSKCVQLFA